MVRLTISSLWNVSVLLFVISFISKAYGGERRCLKFETGKLTAPRFEDLRLIDSGEKTINDTEQCKEKPFCVTWICSIDETHFAAGKGCLHRFYEVCLGGEENKPDDYDDEHGFKLGKNNFTAHESLAVLTCEDENCDMREHFDDFVKANPGLDFGKKLFQDVAYAKPETTTPVENNVTTTTIKASTTPLPSANMTSFPLNNTGGTTPQGNMAPQTIIGMTQIFGIFFISTLMNLI